MAYCRPDLSLGLARGAAHQQQGHHRSLTSRHLLAPVESSVENSTDWPSGDEGTVFVAAHCRAGCRTPTCHRGHLFVLTGRLVNLTDVHVYDSDYGPIQDL